MSSLLQPLKQIRTTQRIKALFSAAAEGDVAKAEAILDRGIDLTGYEDNPKTGAFGTQKYFESAIMAAAKNGKAGTLEMLLRRFNAASAPMNLNQIETRAALLHRMTEIALDNRKIMGQQHSAGYFPVNATYTLKDLDESVDMLGTASEAAVKHAKGLRAALDFLHQPIAKPQPVLPMPVAQPPKLVFDGALTVKAIASGTTEDIPAPTAAVFKKKKAVYTA